MLKRALLVLTCLLFANAPMSLVNAQSNKIPFHKYVSKNYKISLPVFWGPIPEQKLTPLQLMETNPDGTTSILPVETRGWLTTNNNGAGKSGMALVNRARWDKSACAFIKVLITNLKTLSPTLFKIQSRGTTRIDHKKAKWFISTLLVGGKKSKQLSYVLTAGKHVYYLNFSSTLDDFPDVKKTFQEIAKTLDIN